MITFRPQNTDWQPLKEFYFLKTNFEDLEIDGAVSYLIGDNRMTQTRSALFGYSNIAEVSTYSDDNFVIAYQDELSQGIQHFYIDDYEGALIGYSPPNDLSIFVIHVDDLSYYQGDVYGFKPVIKEHPEIFVPVWEERFWEQS